MKVIRVITVVTACLVLQVKAKAKPAHCSVQDLRGPYGYVVTGSNGSGKTNYTISGRFTSDGAGTIRGSAVQSVAGTVIHMGLSGTYNVETDCTGAATFNLENRVTAHISFVIVSNGRKIILIVTDEGAVEIGEAYKQFY